MEESAEVVQREPLMSDSSEGTPELPEAAARGAGEVSNPASFEYSEPSEDSSEDVFDNRALPNDDVQGYNVYGKAIELPREPEPGEKL